MTRKSKHEIGEQELTEHLVARGFAEERASRLARAILDGDPDQVVAILDEVVEEIDTQIEQLSTRLEAMQKHTSEDQLSHVKSVIKEARALRESVVADIEEVAELEPDELITWASDSGEGGGGS